MSAKIFAIVLGVITFTIAIVMGDVTVSVATGGGAASIGRVHGSEGSQGPDATRLLRGHRRYRRWLMGVGLP